MAPAPKPPPPETSPRLGLKLPGKPAGGRIEIEPTEGEFGKILKTFDGFNESKITSGHNTNCPVLEFLGRRRAWETARALPLPEVAPDRNELNAQPPSRAAAGEEYSPAIFHRGEHRSSDVMRPT